MINLKKDPLILKIFYLVIFAGIFCIQMYLAFWIIPHEQTVFEECNLKILCEEGYLKMNYPDPNHPCYKYIQNYNIPDNFTFNVSIE